MTEIHPLYKELQRQIDVLEGERKVLNEQFALLPESSSTPSPGSREAPLRIINVLTAQLWYQSNYTPSKFRQLLVSEEQARGQKVYNLHMAQVPLGFTAEQKIQLAEVQKEERIRLAEIAKDEKTRLAEIAKEEKVRLSELEKEDRRQTNEIAKDGRIRLEELEKQDRERQLQLEADKIKFETEVRKQEIAANADKAKRDVKLKKLELDDEADKRRAEAVVKRLALDAVFEAKMEAEK
ncbi:hypothetical protein BGZ65_009493, partial [Modicella reniformis]